MNGIIIVFIGRIIGDEIIVIGFGGIRLLARKYFFSHRDIQSGLRRSWNGRSNKLDGPFPNFRWIYGHGR